MTSSRAGSVAILVESEVEEEELEGKVFEDEDAGVLLQTCA